MCVLDLMVFAMGPPPARPIFIASPRSSHQKPDGNGQTCLKQQLFRSGSKLELRVVLLAELPHRRGNQSRQYYDLKGLHHSVGPTHDVMIEEHNGTMASMLPMITQQVSRGHGRWPIVKFKEGVGYEAVMVSWSLFGVTVGSFWDQFDSTVGSP